MPTGDKLYEDLQKEREENKKAMAALVARLEEYQKQLGGMNQAQPESLNLNKDEISEFKNRLAKNLNRREDAADYLTGLLYRKTPDPTDPLADMISERSPIQMQRELKAEARQGKSKVGNFFRNLDYALGDGAGRDLGIANKIQSEARTNLDNLLKDQGTEIQRAFQIQNALAGKVAAQNQKNVSEAGKLASDAARTQGQYSLGDMRTGLSGAQIASQVDLNALRGDFLKEQTKTAKLRNEYFTPMGVGQDAAFAALVERMRKTDPKGAAELEAKGRENAMVRSAIGGMFKPQQGTTSTTTRPSVHWTKDANGNDVEIRGAPVTSTTTRGGGGMGVDPAKFLQGLLEKGQTGRESTSPLETLRKAAQETSQNRSTRPQSIVNEALTNTQDANANAMRATAALNPQVSEQDRKDLLRGKRYVIEWNPRAKKGFEGTRPGQDAGKATDLSSKVRTDLNTAMSFMLEAGADGTMEKAMGYDPITGKNIGATVHNSLSTNLPRNIKGFILGDANDPDYEMRRMFPGMGQDAQTQKFRTQFQILMKSLGFDIQKDSTGLQALGQEMENIKTFLPKSTDHPTVALATILSMGVKKNVEGHLLRLGYTPADAESVMKDAGDYIGPRVVMLAERMKEAKSAYASGKIKTRSELAKMFKFSDLDTDDIIGAALDKKGVPFESLPISIRRLGEVKRDKAEMEADKLPPLEGGYNPQESLLETLRKKQEMEKRGKKWVVTPPKF